jgi:lipopolysaccharide transport system permease protein
MTSDVDFASDPVADRAAADSPAEPLLQPDKTVARAVGAHQATTVIRPSTGWQLVNFRELWQYRGLIYHLIWRDVKVRYKHTFIGVGWAVIQPFMMMLVFASYFAFLHTPKPGETPYPVYVFTGMMPWLFFASATTQASHSVVNSEHLITRIYFPRLAIAFAAVGAFVVDFIVAFILLLILLMYFGLGVSTNIILAPVVLALFILAALAVGTLMAVLNVKYKDFRLVIPFFMQWWFFATPNIFFMFPTIADDDQQQVQVVQDFRLAGMAEAPHEAEAVTPKSPAEQLEAKETERVRRLKARHELFMLVNPICPLVEFLRGSILGTPIPWVHVGISVTVILVLFFIGTMYFHKLEDKFADII